MSTDVVFTQADLLAGRCLREEIGMPSEPRFGFKDHRDGRCREDQIGKPDTSARSSTLTVIDPDEDVVAYARRLATKALQTIEGLMSDDDAAVALRASNSILDRGYGKPIATQLNINPPEQVWPEWLSARRLAYQESARYAEDIVPLELQNVPRERPQAPEVVEAIAPRPSPFTPFTRKFDLGDKAYIPPVYTSYAKSQPVQAHVVPPENKVTTPVWGIEPEPYDERTEEERIAERKRTPQQAEEHALEQAYQAQARIGELEQARDREWTPELEEKYRQAVNEGMARQQVYMRAKEARERAEREPRREPRR